MKKIIAVLLTLTLVLTNGITVLAEDNTPPSNQISSNPDYAIGVWYGSSHADTGDGTKYDGGDGLAIVLATSGIQKNGSGSVAASGTTEANLTCVEIGGIVHVQRWKNGSWNTYYSFSFYSNNAVSASGTRTVSVESGYYYRVVCQHTATTTVSNKYATSSTSSILVN